MNDIIISAEKTPMDRADPARPDDDDPVSWAIARAAAQLSDDVGAAAIVCPTHRGSTARRVAAFRPSCPIVAATADLARAEALALTWGVTPVAMLEAEVSKGRLQDQAVAAAKRYGFLRPGAVAVVVEGSPSATAGSTDLIHVIRA